MITRSETARIDIPIWERVWKNDESVFREWVLEFYCSLKVEKTVEDSELATANVISFRLGGQEHTMSMVEFGRLAGLFTDNEARNALLMEGYLADAEKDNDDFGANEVWNEWTGLGEHHSKCLVKDIPDPVLRILHKLNGHTVVQRATQHDKCYEVDLWMLHKFSLRDPTQYVNVAWILARHMASKGKGQTKSSQLVCGQFISRMVRRLGYYTRENVANCSPPVECKVIGLQDLGRSGLLTPTGSLIPFGVRADPPPPLAPRPRVPTTREMLGEVTQGIHRMDFRSGEMEQQLSSLVDYTRYHYNRYQPTLEDLARQRHEHSGMSAPWEPYVAPQLYYPHPYQGYPGFFGAGGGNEGGHDGDGDDMDD